MSAIANDQLVQLFAPFFLWFFFIFGLVGCAVGAGLLVYGARMQGFFGLMNRWVSTRRTFTRRWVGLCFVVGGAFPLFTLLRWLSAKNFDLALGGAIHSPVLAWGVEALCWILIVGNLFSIAVGAMLLLARGPLAAGDKPRSAGSSEDRMYLALDRWAASFPRLIGGAIAVGALIVAGRFGLVLFGSGS